MYNNSFKVALLVKKEIFIIFSLILLVVAIYFQAGNFEFIDFDDYIYVKENTYIQKGLSFENIIWSFKSFYAANWHPLTWISHMIDVELYGMNPGGHHQINLIIHIFTTILWFILLFRVTKDIWKSAFVAILFGIHPLHVESVAQIAERKDVLSGFFWATTILSYIWYVEYPNKIRYVITIILYALGLMAKPMLVTLPFVLLLFDFWPLKRLIKKYDNNISEKQYCKVDFFKIIEKLPFIVMCVLSCIITYIAQKEGGAVTSLNDFPIEARFLNSFVSYTRYIYKMIVPVELAFFYPFAKVSWWKGLLSLAFIFFVTWLCLRNIERKPFLIMGWLWYLGTLVPVIGIVQVGGQAFADRYSYIPLIGLFIMIAWGLPSLISKIKVKKYIYSVLAFLVLLIFAILSWKQTTYWKNSISLFNHALNVTESNLVAHNNIGTVFDRMGKKNEAIEHFNSALKIKPSYAEVHSNLGMVLGDIGKNEEALFHLDKAIEINPMLKKAHNNKGLVLEAMGRIDEAIKYFNNAIELDPDYEDAMYNLGVAYYRKGMIPEAIDCFKAVMKNDPNYAAAYNSLGVILARQGKVKEGIALIETALQVLPDFPTAQNNLFRLKFRNSAVDLNEKSIDPD